MPAPAPGTFPSSTLFPGDEVLPDYPNSIGDEATLDFAPVIDMHGDPQSFLSAYLHALAFMFKQVDDIAKDGPDGQLGWSQIFDLNRAKVEWLPWIGQITGYRVPSQASDQSVDEYYSKERDRIVTRSAWLRGTVSSIRLAAQDHLSDPKRVNIIERFGGNAYHIHVSVYASDIVTSEAEITRAVKDDKVAGLLLDWAVLVGESWNDLLTGPYGGSWAATQAQYPTWIDVLNG